MESNVDVEVVNHCSIYQFHVNPDPDSDVMDWVEENLPLESWQWMGNNVFAVESRFAYDIVVGMRRNGFVVVGY